MTYTVLCGDVSEVLPTLAPESFDAVLCDPPYGLSFMGKAWDHGVPSREVWEAVARTLKPGAHLLAFGGTRTFHRLACAIEDAGFEVRDCLSWLYGSGFPKSLDISKAIDKAAGAEPKMIGLSDYPGREGWNSIKGAARNPGEYISGTPPVQHLKRVITAPATDAARQWQGYGTALKPAWEIAILSRKPEDLRGLCGILALTITGAICQLAKRAASSSGSSLQGSSEAFGSARWDAVSECSTPGALFDLTATWPSGLEIPSTLSTGLSWLATLGEVLRLGSTFTTETESSLTTDLRTLNCSPSPITPDTIIEAATNRHGTASSASLAGATFAAVAARLALIRARSAAGPATSTDVGAGLRPDLHLISLAMKPTDGTFAENALRHGVAGLNVDGGRIGTTVETWPASRSYAPGQIQPGGKGVTQATGPAPLGRWPANVILDEDAARALDEAVGERKAGNSVRGDEPSIPAMYDGGLKRVAFSSHGDTGGPSRFFYVSKASRREREAGLEGFEAKRSASTSNGGIPGRPMTVGAASLRGEDREPPIARNHHPTVKPLALCEYLARLILPPKRDTPRRLLVPFSGSGSEMIGALLAGWDEVVGIEREAEYVAIAEARLKHWTEGAQLELTA